MLALASILWAKAAPAAYSEVIEEHLTYTAVKGDYLEKIAGINGVELKELLKQNPQEGKYIHPGDSFTVERRHIVPEKTSDGVIVNVPDRTIYLFRDGKLAAHYPAGLGKPSWRTPVGEFTVTGKVKNPTWHVPKDIQEEYAKKGKFVPPVVPPGPDNPLGRYVVKLSIPMIHIHETIWPESIYKFRSHGCIRLKPGDAEKFFDSVNKGDTGAVIYEPVKLAATRDGKVFLEVHPDIYGLTKDLMEEARKEIESSGLGDKVDWEKVGAVVKAKDGIATDVTKQDVNRGALPHTPQGPAGP
jgi:L,D-transpeptidase ErfK/SrfK